MFVSLSITLKTFKFLTLFLALIGKIDAGVTIDGFKGSDPRLNRKKYEKNFSHIKFIAIKQDPFLVQT